VILNLAHGEDNIKTLNMMHPVEELPPKETFPDYGISTKEFIYVHCSV
jgi:hypothetical protein